MKRILYSCFLVLSLFLVKKGNAQNYNFTITPATYCYDGVTPVLGQAAVNSTGTSTSFSFTVQEPAGCPVATFTYDPTFPNGSGINVTYNCCGIYVITGTGYTNGVLTATQQKFPQGTCVNNVTITTTANTNSYICLGDVVNLTANGALTYTWSDGSTNAGTSVSPTSNQCYTVTGTTASGCTVQAVTCLSVQVTTETLSPTSLTTCANNNATITAAASSNSTGIQWYGPPGLTPLGTSTAQVINTPNNATYTAVVTSNGLAGSCTVQALSSVVISTAIPMGLTPSSPSVCPGATFTLTASPSGANSYTFYPPGPPTASFVSASGTSTVSGPGTYVVNANYNGCPGSATVTVFTATLTPTLTAGPTPSTCPGLSVNLTATGGSTYTFSYQGSGPPTNIGTNTTGTVTHFPPVLPAIYRVNASQGGCTGSATLTVNEAPVYARISTASRSVCPTNSFVLTGQGGFNYTFTPVPLTGPPITTVTANSATSAIPVGSFPATYSVAVDSLGCRGGTTITMQARVLTTSIIPSSISGSVCPASTFTLHGSNGANTSYTFASVPTSTAITITPTSPGSGTVTSAIPSGSFPVTYTVSADSSGCQGTASITINLLSLNHNILVTAQTNGVLTPSVCPGSQFTLVATNGGTASSGTTYTYLPTTPPITITSLSAKNETVVSVIPSGSFPYTYTVTADSVGCVGSKTITVNQLFIHPTLTVVPSGSVCAGSTVTLTASSLSSNTLIPTTYLFGYGPLGSPLPTGTLGVPGSTNNIATHNPTVATVYFVAADSSGCTTPLTGLGTTTIGMLPNLTPTLTATSPTVCSGQQATLSVNNVTTYTYTWFSSANPAVPLSTLPTNPADTAIVVNPTVSLTYTVHAIDPGGCAGDAVKTISVNPTASLTISSVASPTAVCPNQSSTLTASGALSYTWSPSASLNNASGAVVISSPSATIIYTVRGDNTLGCYGASTVAVNVVTYPTLTISPTANSVCVGYTSTLTAFGAVNYTWTGNGMSGNTLPPVYNPIAPVYQQSIAVSPGTYTLYGSNGGACIDSSHVISIGLSPPLIITASPSTNTTCIANNSPKYSKPVILTASGGSSYSWLPYNPSTVTYSLGPSTTVIPPASTCYTVTGYTSVCSGSAVVCVTVIPQFTMNVVPPLPAMCIGDSIKLNIVNISTLAVGPVSAFTYSWTEPENAVLTLSNPLSSTVIAFPQSTSTYSVEMRDSRSCVSIPRLVTVTVYPRPLTTVSIPTINSVPTNTVCFVAQQPGEDGNLLTLTASNANVGLPFGVVPTYTWLPPPEYLPSHNSILTSVNNNFVTVNAPIRTPSVVVYSVLSGYNGIPGCSRLDTVSVRVIDCRFVTPDKVKFITDKAVGDTICARECVTFTSLTDTAAGGPQKLLWTFAGGAPATSTVQFPTVCYNLPGTHNVILRVQNPYPTSQGGSSATSGVLNYIKVVDVPNVTVIAPGGIRSDTTVRFGQSVSLSGSGALSYIWTPPYNISSLTNPNVTVHPFQTTQYILTGYNSKTCSSSDTVNVIIIPDCGEMYVPNAFSPNGDGHNDILFVRGICLESLTFMVFNRWGEKVFETIDQKVGWNGSYRGEDANTGVYVYRLEGKTYDGKGFSLKGNITLIR